MSDVPILPGHSFVMRIRSGKPFSAELAIKRYRSDTGDLGSVRAEPTGTPDVFLIYKRS